jgi:hypothetical protein
VGQPANKSKFCEHIEKVIREAEKYKQYLQVKWQQAQKAGLTQYDESKDKDKWTWWNQSGYDFMGDSVYFAEFLSAYFYIEGKPEPDPLGYLYSMLYGCRGGQICDGLELLDYQYILLAIIHDAQSWKAGQESIYFNSLSKETLADRICGAACKNIKDAQQAIETALLAVKADLQSAQGLSLMEQGKSQKKVKPSPKKEAIQAYKLLNSIEFRGKRLQVIADTMNDKLHRKDIKPYMITRWKQQVEKYLKQTGLPIASISTKPDEIPIDPDKIDMGEREDGITPRQRPEESTDEDG